MQTTIRALLGAALVVTAFGVAVAKLPPAPPMTDEQKAEKAAKDKADRRYGEGAVDEGGRPGRFPLHRRPEGEGVECAKEQVESESA